MTSDVSKASLPENRVVRQRKYSTSWDEERMRKVLEHYEAQNEEEVVVEDEAAFDDPSQTVMEIPNELVPAVRELIAKHQE